MKKNIFISSCVLLLCLLIDLATKDIIFSTMRVGDSLCIIPGVLYLKPTYNPGGVFGIMRESGNALLVVSLIAIPVIILIYFSIKNHSVLTLIAFGCMLGGAFGNLFDRLFIKEGVRDFISWEFGVKWPVFNIADSAISIGIFIVLFDAIFFEKYRKCRPTHLQQ